MNNQPLGYATQSFNVELAQRLKSADLAILIQFFINCIRVHKRLNRNFKDGRTWNFCTRRELSETFPWLSMKQCERLLKKLVDNKILMKGNFNKMRGDNTVWYAFCNESDWNIKEEKPKPEPLPKSGDPSRNRPSNTTPLPTYLPKEQQTPKKSVVRSSKEEEEAAQNATEYLDRASESLDHNLKIPKKKILELIHKYSLRIVMEHINYLVEQQKKAQNPKYSRKKNKPTPIENPVNYLKLACYNNWAEVDLE